ncbi:MAG: PKD domain-containing protein [Planctomycetota bacterium]|nr:MAG: PKD domain-containing protein [Planctomycetota bacterium]
MLNIKPQVLVLVMLMPATVMAQVSMELLHNSTNTLTMEPGTAQLNLQVRLTSSIPLDGVQFGILSSNGDLFAFSGDPTVTHGSPFKASEFLFLEYLPPDGTLLSTLPVFAYFSFNNIYPADSFPSVIMTISISSVGTLAEGTYTFVTGDIGGGFIWTSTPDSGTFDASGTFVLNVTSSGGGGNGGGTPTPGNQAPSADISADVTSGTAPLTIQFDASGSSDPDAGTTLTYIWDFGDGSTGNGVTVSYTYSTGGRYNAVLTVDDGNGGTDVAGLVINVTSASGGTPTPTPSPTPTPGPTPTPTPGPTPTPTPTPAPTSATACAADVSGGFLLSCMLGLGLLRRRRYW